MQRLASCPGHARHLFRTVWMYKFSDDDFASSTIFKLRKVSKITLSMIDRHLSPCRMPNAIRNWILSFLFVRLFSKQSAILIIRLATYTWIYKISLTILEVRNCPEKCLTTIILSSAYMYRDACDEQPQLRLADNVDKREKLANKANLFEQVYDAYRLPNERICIKRILEPALKNHFKIGKHRSRRVQPSRSNLNHSDSTTN